MKCRVTIPLLASVTVTVDADSADDAVEKASEAADFDVCWICGSRITVTGMDEESSVVEMDGKTLVLNRGAWEEE